MTEAPQDYWARRAGEEAQLALRAANKASAVAHGELARAYRERARLLSDNDDGSPASRRAGAR